MVCIELVTRQRDALGAICRDCGAIFNVTTCPYWHWSKSRAMHQQSGHVMDYYTFSAQPVAYTNVTQDDWVLTA